MKLSVRILTLAVLMAALAPSCDKSNPENGGSVTPTPTPTPTPEPKPTQADYTILYYGCGGGNLDAGDEYTILDMAKALPEKDSNVRILAQYKYSSPKSTAFTAKDNTLSGEAGHLYRYEVSPKIIAPKNSKKCLILPQDAQYGNQNGKSELFQPDSIASFIKYGVATAPAKDYVLIFCGHGNGYNLFEDIPGAEKTKSTVGDENHESNPGVTMYQIKEGIARSGVNITLLAFESCEMGQIEVVAELQGSAKYMLASGHSINSLAHSEFIYALLDGEPLMESMAEYAQVSLNNNLSNKDGNMNFAVTDFSQTEPFFKALKEITDYMCKNVKDNLKGYKTAAGKTFQFEKEDSKFDIYDYLCFLGSDVYKDDAEYTRLLENVSKTLEKAQPIHYNSLSCKGNKYYDKLSYSVVLGAQGYIVEYSDHGKKQIARDKKGSTYKLKKNVVGVLLDENEKGAWNITYNLTAFDKTVGWSRWFEKNPAFPRNNPPFFLFQTEDDEVSDLEDFLAL